MRSVNRAARSVSSFWGIVAEPEVVLPYLAGAESRGSLSRSMGDCSQLLSLSGVLE